MNDEERERDGGWRDYKKGLVLENIMYEGIHSEVDTGPTCTCRVYQNAYNAFLIRSLIHIPMTRFYCTISDALGTKPSSFNVCPKSI